ncbi:carbonic anhydrase [Sarracenia purpurea var. burkii]
MASRLAFFVLATPLLLLHTSAASEGPETPPGFSYSGDTGPYKWGSLSPVYAACSTGKWQSPINILKHSAVLNKNLKPLRREYHPVNATLVDNGYNVGVCSCLSFYFG